MNPLDPVERLHWLLALACNASVKPAALRVAVALANRQNCATGQLNPGASRLSEDTSLEVRSVRRAIKELEALGAVGINHSTGGKSSDTNRYMLIPVTEWSPLTPESPLTGESVTPDSEVTGPLTSESPKQGKEQGKEQEKRKRKRSTPDEHPLFDRWYSRYPLKKSKGSAVKAFNKLDPDVALVDMMISALERQIVERAAKRERDEWIPEWRYPATWLNAQAWLDEPEKGEQGSDYNSGAL